MNSRKTIFIHIALCLYILFLLSLLFPAKSILARISGNQSGTPAENFAFLPLVVKNYPQNYPPGHITFTLISSDRNDAEIYLINSNGTGLINLSNSPAWDYFPSWSPDGTRLVFISNRNSKDEIFIMNLNSMHPIPLLNNPPWDKLTDIYAWSPDGTKIAFEADQEVYIISSDGITVTNLSTHSAYDWSPTWSPDSSQLIFVSGRLGVEDLYIVNADGTDLKLLANNANSPDWSSDGSKIAFQCAQGICTIKPDGTELTPLTNDPTLNDSSPIWNPTGNGIAFMRLDSLPERDYEIYIMNNDGTGLKRLTNNITMDYIGGWSPDGMEIVYEAVGRYITSTIQTIGIDGTGPSYIADGSQPVWRP